MEIQKFVFFWRQLFQFLESVIPGLYSSYTIERAGIFQTTEIPILKLLINLDLEIHRTLGDFLKGGRGSLARRTPAFENGKPSI